MITLFICLFISYLLLFLISVKIKDNSIVDIFWWVWFIILAIGSFILWKKEVPQFIITTLIIIWWLRLSFHIGLRKWKEKREDLRYAKWREEWGSWAYFYLRSFFQVYILQMILMGIVALPIFFVNFSSESPKIDMWLIIGLSLALFGFIFELIADYQLREFIKIKKPGEIFMAWLYKYSRHPNYFGESTFWLGISFIGIHYSLFSIIGWWAITILLLFVSGVPLQEIRYAGRPWWEDYKRKTSVFIPWFPKK